MTTIRQLVMLMAVAVSLLACASKQMVRTIGDQPRWALMSSGFNNGPYGKGFYGVGVALNAQNEAAGRDVADVFARQNLAKMLANEIVGHTKVYRSNASGGAGDSHTPSSMGQLVRSGGTEFVNMEISGVTIPEHWYNYTDKSEYALAYLDLESFKDALAKMKEMSSSAKEALSREAEEFWGEMDRKSQKPSQQ